MSIELKMGLTADIDQNLVLLDCQPGIEIRTGDPPRFKIGDGVSKWSALSYASPDPKIYTDTAINYNLVFQIGSVSFSGSDLYTLNSSSNLGLPTAMWNSVYSNVTYANTITSYSNSSITCGKTFNPSTSATCDLGGTGKGGQWKSVHLQNATSTDPATSMGGIYFATNTYPTIYHYSTSLCFHPSGGSGTDSFILEPVYFYNPSGSAALGKSGHGWSSLVLGSQGRIRFTNGAADATTRSALSENSNPADSSKYNLYLGGVYNSNLFYADTDYAETHIVGERIEFNMPDLYRAIIIGNDTTSGFYMSGYDTSSGTSKPSLGRTNQRWGTVYCISVSESSDSKDKSDIQYITSNSISNSNTATSNSISNTTTRKARARAASVSNDASSTISTEDVISFVKNCSPATFVYKGVQNAPDTVSEAIISSPEAVHLGLIADDIENDVVFPFIGAKSEFTEDDGTKASQLSLKPLSVAVAALTACKYLLNEVETLKNQLNNVG